MNISGVLSEVCRSEYRKISHKEQSESSRFEAGLGGWKQESYPNSTSKK